jgi:hypothetical protein
MDSKQEDSTVMGRCITINYYALTALEREKRHLEGMEKEVAANRNLNHSQSTKTFDHCIFMVHVFSTFRTGFTLLGIHH